MAIFKYKALDASGKKVSGLQEAENQRHARQELRNINLITVSLSKVDDTKNTKSLFTKNIKSKNLVTYIKQLSVMINSGLPIESALSVIIQQNNNKHDKIIWSSIKSSVNEGVSLSNSMLNFAGSFPNFLIAGVASGEKSGKLGEVLANISITIERKNKFISSISNAVIYPVIVSIVALSVIVVLLTFVVPQIVSVFGQLDKELPALTIGLISVSNFFSSYLDYLLLGLVVFAVFIKWFKNNTATRKYWDSFWLFLPFFNSLIKEVESIKFIRTMATLLSGGVVVVEAIHYSINSLNNSVIATRMLESKNSIKEGKSIINSFEKVKLFNPMSLQLIHLGEVTGTIDKALTDIADMLEDNFNQRINRYLAMFEPLLILVMGGVVLVIVLAILLPIFELNQISG